MPIEGLKVFAYICERERFKSGDFIFSQNEDDARAYFLISGTAELVRTINGEEHVLHEIIEEEFIGGLALLGVMRRMYSLRAKSDMVVLTIERDKFASAMSQFPDVWPKIVRAVAEGINTWEERYLVSHAERCEHCNPVVGVSLI